MEEKEGISSISRARTLDEIAEFWDTHSLADYDDQTYEVERQFDPSARRTCVGIEEICRNPSRVSREQFFTLIDQVQERTRQVPATELEKVVAEAVEAAKQEEKTL